MSSAVNLHEQTARAAKVDAVVALLDQAKNAAGNSDRDIAGLLLELGDDGWRALEWVAQVRPLSEQSRAAVLRRFENRVRGVA